MVQSILASIDKFDVDNPDIVLLLTRVIVDIDNVINGESDNTQEIKKFSSLLSDTVIMIKDDINNFRNKGYSTNPIVSSIINSAFIASSNLIVSKDKPVDISGNLNKVSELVNENNTFTDKEKLSELKSFFIAILRKIRSYKSTFANIYQNNKRWRR